MPAASLRLTNAVSSSIVVTSTNGNYPFGIRGTVRCPAGMRAFGGGAHVPGQEQPRQHSRRGDERELVTADGAGWTFSASHPWDFRPAGGQHPRRAAG